MLEQLKEPEDQFFGGAKKQQERSPKVKEFHNPPSQFCDVRFSDVSEIVKYIESIGTNYYRVRRRGNYLYISCKFCSARISMFGHTRIIQFHNHHVHIAKNNRHIEQKMVMDLMGQANSLESPQQTKHRIMTLVPINQRRYRYILNKHLDHNSYEQAISYIQERNYSIRVLKKEEEKLPELMLIMSPQMKKWARKYSDVFTFDVTYHLLRHRSQANRQWGVGIFTTFDSNLAILPVAFALILKEDTNSFATLFRGFLEFVETRVCTFITDDQAAIKSALDHLSSRGIFSGSHLLDDFHLLRNIRSSVAAGEFKQYYQLITAKHPQKCLSVYTALLAETTTPHLLQSIWKDRERTCYSQGREKFVGLRNSTASGEKCNDMIKTLLPKQSNIFRLILAFKRLEDKITKRIPKFERKKYEQLFQDRRIEEVRNGVQIKIFQAFLKNYVHGLKLQIEQMVDSDLYTVEGYKTSGNECSCGVTVKSGIPCPHMLALLIRNTDRSYVNYFNWRWVDLHENSQIAHYPRKSRRRRK